MATFFGHSPNDGTTISPSHSHFVRHFSMRYFPRRSGQLCRLSDRFQEVCSLVATRRLNFALLIAPIRILFIFQKVCHYP